MKLYKLIFAIIASQFSLIHSYYIKVFNLTPNDYYAAVNLLHVAGSCTNHQGPLPPFSYWTSPDMGICAGTVGVYGSSGKAVADTKDITALPASDKAFILLQNPCDGSYHLDSMSLDNIPDQYKGSQSNTKPFTTISHKQAQTAVGTLTAQLQDGSKAILSGTPSDLQAFADRVNKFGFKDINLSQPTQPIAGAPVSNCTITVTLAKAADTTATPSPYGNVKLPGATTQQTATNAVLTTICTDSNDPVFIEMQKFVQAVLKAGGLKTGTPLTVMTNPIQVPEGSYKKDCTNCSSDGKTLSCTCSGNATSLDITSCLFDSDITNNNGQLSCKTQ